MECFFKFIVLLERGDKYGYEYTKVYGIYKNCRI